MSELDSSGWDESADSPSAVSDGETPPVVAPPVGEPLAAPPVPGPDDDDGPDDEIPAEGARDAKGRFRSRPSRARSQDALPEDRPRIKELTKRLRTVEQELAAERQARATPQPRPVFDVPTVPTEAFAEAEPTLEEFADKDDPYGAWQRALARYDRRKEDHERVLAHQTQHVQRLSQESQQRLSQAAFGHAQRLVQAEQARPGITQFLQQAQARVGGPVPPVLDWSIVLDNDSVDVALFLATHPTVLDELVLMTTAQPVTEQTVAATRRVLRQRMSAVGSGAVAPSQPFSPAPRPPTPLRTAQLIAGDVPPGDDDSVEAHERYFHRHGRRSFRR